MAKVIIPLGREKSVTLNHNVATGYALSIEVEEGYAKKAIAYLDRAEAEQVIAGLTAMVKGMKH